MDIQQTRQLPRTVAVSWTRRVSIGILGAALIIAGLLLLPLPGPFTIALVFLGLTVLSWEFAWARRLLMRTKEAVRRVRSRRRRR